jgi:glycosyltransferase involved in cell wall biosynthesis
MKVIFLGKYCSGETLTGPDKVAKRIFFQHTLKEQSYFLEYFFDGNVYGYFKKLFGKEIISKINKGFVYRLGIIQMIYFIFKLHPDILHIISFHRFPVILLLFKFILKFKVVYNVHGIVQHEDIYFHKSTKFLKFRNKFSEKIIVKFSDNLLILSDVCKKILLQYYSYNEDKVVLIENGIDRDFHECCKYRNNKEINILNVLFPAKIDRLEKGFNQLKECLKSLKMPINIYLISKNFFDVNKFNNEYLNIFTLETMPAPEFAKFLCIMDIVFCSSIYEPFSINLVESMGAGVIPIASEFTGASRFITNEMNGFIIDFKDTEKFINLINKLSVDVDYREKISKNASEIYEILSWDKVYKKYANVYNKLLGEENINRN